MFDPLAGRLQRLLRSAFAAALSACCVLVCLPASAAMPDCANPHSIDESSLCIQRHAVGVAEQLNFETMLSILVSGVGTVALVVTVYYSRRATLAAVQASSAAQTAIGHAREASIRELRPYMVQQTTMNNRILNADGAILPVRRIDVRWRNEGRTPAINVRARANHLVCDGPLPADFAFPDRDSNNAVGTIGAGRTFDSPTANITFDEIRLLMAGKQTLHLWSWVEYEGFDPDVRYRSEYHVTVDYWGTNDLESENLNITTNLVKSFNGVDSGSFRPPAPAT